MDCNARADVQPAQANLQLKDAVDELERFKKEAAAAAVQAAEERKALIDRLTALEKAAPATQSSVARLTESVYEQCHQTVVYDESSQTYLPYAQP